MTNANAKALGKLGGEATKRKYGPEYYTKLSKIMVDAKRAKKASQTPQ